MQFKFILTFHGFNVILQMNFQPNLYFKLFLWLWYFGHYSCIYCMLLYKQEHLTPRRINIKIPSVIGWQLSHKKYFYAHIASITTIFLKIKCLRIQFLLQQQLQRHNKQYIPCNWHLFRRHQFSHITRWPFSHQ